MRLHDRLAVVEGAVDGERVDVGGVRRRHHALLHVGDAAVREQHDEIDLVAVAERLDRGAAGVAGGRDHDSAALAARRQRMVHQARQKLHRHVLEGERRAVKKLERERVGAELAQRHHGGMAKGAVGLAHHAGEIGRGDRVAGEQPDHVERHLRIGPAGEARDGGAVERRPSLRHIEAAVAGKAREHHFGEAQAGGFPSGGDVAQNNNL